MTQTLKYRQVITDNFTSASVSISKISSGWSFKIDYFALEVITKFIQRRFSGVAITKQTSTTIEGYFNGLN